MNNPNPFVPKGSLLEQQSQRRSRLYIAVSCVLAVSIIGLVAVLIQGCKREKPVDELNPPVMDNTNPPALDTNPPPYSVSNPPVVLPPVVTNPPVVIPPVGADTGGGTKYIIQKGDSFFTLHKKFGVSIAAIQAANPGVDSKKLKIGNPLIIPAAVKTPAGASPVASLGGAADAAGETYTVKSGDTLEKLHKKFGVSVKTIQSANNLTTTKIKVGQKLKIPSKGEAAAPAPAPAAPVVDTTPAPALPPVSAPAPAPAPTH